jgi:hypothetical protein
MSLRRTRQRNARRLRAIADADDPGTGATSAIVATLRRRTRNSGSAEKRCQTNRMRTRAPDSRTTGRPASGATRFRGEPRDRATRRWFSASSVPAGVSRYVRESTAA